MSYYACPKCGAVIHGAVACEHCGRMPTKKWPWRHNPPRKEGKHPQETEIEEDER